MKLDIFHVIAVLLLIANFSITTGSDVVTSYYDLRQYLLGSIPINKELYWAPWFPDKSFIGVSIRVINVSTSSPTVGITPQDIADINRFNITGNNTFAFTLVVKKNVSVNDMKDVYDVVRNVSVFWPHGRDSKDVGVALEWHCEREGLLWCPACKRYVRRIPDLYTYENIVTGRFHFESTLGVMSGFVVLNDEETKFLVDKQFYGLACGRYNVETIQWEWGCDPVAKKRINYTNWASGEPKYEN
eukprot:PhF_6_TR13397/c0_g1_i4/m.21291